MHARGSARVQAPDYDAPAGRPDFAAGLILLSLSLDRLSHTWPNVDLGFATGGSDAARVSAAQMPRDHTADDVSDAAHRPRPVQRLHLVVHRATGTILVGLATGHDDVAEQVNPHLYP